MSIEGQGHSLTLRFQSLFFSDTVGSFEIKFHMKVIGSIGIKLYTNEMGHITKMAAKMAAMPLYGTFSPEPKVRWP